jgi:nucleotidyltransferase substrate binding protein (TIGR01987 family)
MSTYNSYCKTLSNLNAINKVDYPLDVTDEEYYIKVYGIINLFNQCFNQAMILLAEKIKGPSYGGGYPKHPADILKDASSKGLIKGLSLWKSMLKDRNTTQNFIDDYSAEQIVKNIVKLYYPMLLEFRDDAYYKWHEMEITALFD